MATLIQFSRNIRSLGSRIENNSSVLTRKVARTALRSLVLGTPVDKGVARSNWRVSLGARTFKVIPAYSPGKRLGIGERANARAAIAAGNAVINQLRVGRVSGKTGKALIISNNIPYLDRLRFDRHSPQQTGDWVGLALLDAKAAIVSTRLLRRGTVG